LDVTFGEDACRIRTGNAPENLALLKRWSINLLNQETSFKPSTRQKAKRASMDVTYLLQVLNASIPLHSNPSDA
jgi:predicted transposase YbfD/YdcC